MQGKKYDWAIVNLVGKVPQSYSEFGTKVEGPQQGAVAAGVLKLIRMY